MSAPVTLLIGNPNVGKSVIFRLLTGRYVDVSNYPGTTVEVTRGTHRTLGSAVVDTPGMNGLLAAGEDERVTRDMLLRERLAHPVTVLQVSDTKNLARGLQLTLQLAELELATALVANLSDEALGAGLRFDAAGLAARLGIAVFPTVAVKGEGCAGFVERAPGFAVPALRAVYPAPVERTIAELEARMPAGLPGKRGVALLLLGAAEPGPAVAALVPAALVQDAAALRDGLAKELGETVAYAINRTRTDFAATLAAAYLTRDRARGMRWRERAGEWAMHPVAGPCVALAMLYLTYLFVGVLGAGTAVNFLEKVVFAEYVVPWSDAALRFVLPQPIESWMVGPGGLLIGEYGLISMALSYAVAIILPIVSFFFIAFSIMEDSGYLPRLAVVLNRVFNLMGLNGKAVLPMILGLGCDTMATMTTRILPTKKERLVVTLLLALAVPCSAQLAVILAMLGTLSLWAVLTWAGLLGAIVMLVGLTASRLLPGEGASFVLELPPLRRPALANVLLKTVVRVEWYLKEAVPLFAVGTLALWVLDRVHALPFIQRVFEPFVVGMLDLPPKAADAFLIGFLRRDYGAAGLFDLFHDRLLAGHPPVELQIQVVVAMVTITLFIPCVAQFLMMIKERGWKTATAIAAFVVPFALFAGAAINYVLRAVLL
jgi:ferrous iron transport protein B